MSSSNKRVRFTRILYTDELSVLDHFSRHIISCRECLLSGRSNRLCNRGHAYARDIRQYIFFRNGRAYSTLDRYIDNQPVEIKIPPPYGVLMTAIDDSLDVNIARNTGPQKQDRTYYVVREGAPEKRTDRGPSRDRGRKRDPEHLPRRSGERVNPVNDRGAEDDTV